MQGKGPSQRMCGRRNDDTRYDNDVTIHDRSMR